MHFAWQSASSVQVVPAFAPPHVRTPFTFETEMLQLFDDPPEPVEGAGAPEDASSSSMQFLRSVAKLGELTSTPLP